MMSLFGDLQCLENFRDFTNLGYMCSANEIVMDPPMYQPIHSMYMIMSTHHLCLKDDTATIST